MLKYVNRNGVFNGRIYFGNRSFQKRYFNLGNPMFPGIRQPEVNYDFSTPPSDKKGGAKEKDESILGGHGGKIALVAFSLAGLMLWSYFKGSKNKSDVEDRVLDLEPLEPYEVHELRYSNPRLSRRVIERIVDRSVAYCTAHPEGFDKAGGAAGDFMMPYGDFIQLCNKVLAEEEGDLFINSGFLLDRLVMQRATVPADATFGTDGSVSVGKVALRAVPVSLRYLLVMLTMICAGPVEDRCALLFNIGRWLGTDQQQRIQQCAALGDAARNTEGTISYRDFAALLNELMRSSQIPSEKHVIFSEDTIDYKIAQTESGFNLVGMVTSPFRWVVNYLKPKEYTVMRAEEMLDASILNEAEKKRLDMTGIVVPKDTDIAAKKPNGSEITFDNFKLLILGYAVCAWGECYGHHHQDE
jgi:hypothetical protein